MSELTINNQSAAARFDHAFLHARKKPPASFPYAPLLSSTWPQENQEVLKQYQEWLYGGGTGPNMVEMIYVPTAGYTLGLNLKPYHEWDLKSEFDLALDYINARGLSAISTKIRRNALEKFRKFLRQLRGEYVVIYKPIDYERYCTGLPDWLVEQLKRYQHIRQVNWRPARIHQQTMRFWGSHTKIWRWLFTQYPIQEITDIKRQHILDYVDFRLEANYATRSINQELRSFRSFLLFLQDQEYRVTQAILRVPSLKEPDPLPRFLTDEQICLLRDDLESRVSQAQSSAHLRDARLDRAAFYLLWQGGLRLGEVEELRLDDLDLPGVKLMVRRGKGQKDRTVYLTNKVIHALQEHLAVRGPGPTDHVFFYRNRPVSKDLIAARIRASGERAGVKVSPHRLRHTCATQLLNAGCRITSIQKLLGHKRLDTTMIYAQVHDQSVSDDYYKAMARIETRLDLSADHDVSKNSKTITHAERNQILDIANDLMNPQLELETRRELTNQIQSLLRNNPPEMTDFSP